MQQNDNTKVTKHQKSAKSFQIERAVKRNSLEIFLRKIIHPCFCPYGFTDQSKPRNLHLFYSDW